MMKSILAGAVVLVAAMFNADAPAAMVIDCGTLPECDAGTRNSGDMITAQTFEDAAKIDFDLASGTDLSVLISNNANSGQWDVKFIEREPGGPTNQLAARTASAGVAETFAGLDLGQGYRVRVYETAGGVEGKVEMTVTPLPGAVFMLGAGLAGIGFLRRRARKAANA